MACFNKLKQSSIDTFLDCPALKRRALSFAEGQISLYPQNSAILLSSSSQSVDSPSSLSNILLHKEESLPASPNDELIGPTEAAPLVTNGSEETLIADGLVSRVPETSTPIVTYKRQERRKGCIPAVAEQLQKQSPKKGPLNTSFALDSNERHKLRSLLGGQFYRKCCSYPTFHKQTLRRKRICGQYFLDLGQADFSCTTCKLCGLVYACGHENDERLHATFHKSYLQGIQFKGWQRERLVMKCNKHGDRVILVLPTDPPQYQIKVREVASIMEKELGLMPGWLLHNQCKVYLFISSKKVIGCVVAESIKQAYPVFPAKGQAKDAVSWTQESHVPQLGKTFFQLKQSGQSEVAQKPVSKILMFGNAKFEREVQKRPAFKSQDDPASFSEAVICSNIPVNALCGIRGVWVSKADRRKGIASKLLDAVRTSFLYSLVIDSSQCAFSQPTPDGKAFAAKYCRTESFLVYS